MSIQRFSFPTPIHFGEGVIQNLPNYLKANNLKRPMIVTDRGIAELPILEKLKSLLKSNQLEVSLYSEIFGNPTKKQVMEGVNAYKASGADSIIGFGGGAPIDVAKVIALMVTHTGDLFDYEDEKPGAREINSNIPFWVAVPTTSGTGSEVGRSSVISDDETHVKKIIFSPYLIAKAVFADPELTYDLPPFLTATTGMDALTHCVEAYLAKNYHPLCDGIALEGLSLISQNLIPSVRKNNAARREMLMGSMMGAIAFQKGLGIVHSCAHALSALVDMHHGLANAVMIDEALAFNLKTSEDRFFTMANRIGLKNVMEFNAGPLFLDWLRGLKSEVGIPADLTKTLDQNQKPMRWTLEQIEKLSEIAIADACHQNNPRVVQKNDFKTLFQKSAGNLK